ncbi:hypothetical protein [Tenacibaculum xiamenense]|uniref:hypothetical protein n=1 Tax=Tenacibaculum xiamenense TaxID=1261553 RepID=UPI0038955FC5
MKKKYPLDIINSKKIDIEKATFIDDTVSIKKYQNTKNSTYTVYKPVSKLFNLE